MKKYSIFFIFLTSFLFFGQHAYSDGFQNSLSTKPSFVSGQFIVRFQKGILSTPADIVMKLHRSFITALPQEDAQAGVLLDHLNSQYGVTSFEPLFSSTGEAPLVETTAQREQRLEAHRSTVKGFYANRTRRAPMNINVQLDNIYLVNFSSSASPDEVAADYRKISSIVASTQTNNVVRISSFTPPVGSYYDAHATWGQNANALDYDDMWALKKVQPQGAWNITLGLYTKPQNVWNTTTGGYTQVNAGNPVIVAVLDTGVDYTNPGIANNIWKNPNPGNRGYSNDIRGWNFVSNTNDVMDNNGHGTHVAGIIAAAVSSTGTLGVAPQAKIMPVKVMDATGYSTDANVAHGIQYAVENGADIINYSIMGNCSGNLQTCLNDDDLLGNAMTYAYSNGVIIIAAAGNSNEDVSSNFLEYLGVPIIVSAYNQNDNKCGFSNYGAVDIAAPGCGPNDSPDILSLLSSGTPSFAISGAYTDQAPTSIFPVGTGSPKKYSLMAGTSTAVPFVSGAVALLLANNPSWTIENLRAAIHQGADNVDYTPSPGIDAISGWGRLDISKSMAITNPPQARLLRPGLSNLYGWLEGEPYTATVPIYGFESGPYTLSYGQGDAPGTWTIIASSTSPTSSVIPNSGPLGFWNTSNLASGDYVLRLTVTTPSGTYTDQFTTNISPLDITFNGGSKGCFVTSQNPSTCLTSGTTRLIQSALNLCVVPNPGYTPQAYLDGTIPLNMSGACTFPNYGQGYAITTASPITPITGAHTITLTYGPVSTGSSNTTPNNTINTSIVGGSGSGTITCGNASPCPSSVIPGTSLTFTATPNSGWALSSWGGACASVASSNKCTIPVNSDPTNVSANFVPTYTINTVAESGGTITCANAKCPSIVPAGSTVNFTANPTNQSDIVSWRGVCANTVKTNPNVCTITAINSNTVVAAFFMPTYTINTSKGGRGTGTITYTCNGSTCPSSVMAGTSVIFKATPNSGSHFSAWSRCQGTVSSNVCTVTTVNAATNVSANFVR